MAAAGGHGANNTARNSHASNRLQPRHIGHLLRRKIPDGSGGGRGRDSVGRPGLDRGPPPAPSPSPSPAANERQSMPAGHHLGGEIGRHMCDGLRKVPDRGRGEGRRGTGGAGAGTRPTSSCSSGQRMVGDAELSGSCPCGSSIQFWGRGLAAAAAATLTLTLEPSVKAARRAIPPTRCPTFPAAVGWLSGTKRDLELLHSIQAWIVARNRSIFNARFLSQSHFSTNKNIGSLKFDRPSHPIGFGAIQWVHHGTLPREPLSCLPTCPSSWCVVHSVL